MHCGLREKSRYFCLVKRKRKRSGVIYAVHHEAKLSLRFREQKKRSFSECNELRCCGVLVRSKAASSRGKASEYAVKNELQTNGKRSSVKNELKTRA